jgi:predicted PurR-regulated permease PerM
LQVRPSMAAPPMSMTVAARNVLIAVGLGALALLIWAGRDVVFLLFFGLLVGIFLSAPTGWLVGRGMKRSWALALVVLACSGVTTVLILLVGPLVAEQLVTLGRDLPPVLDRAIDWLDARYRSVAGSMGRPVEGIGDRLRRQMLDQTGRLIAGPFPILNTVLGALAGTFMVLAVGIFTAARPQLYRDGFLHLIPPAHRARVADAIERAGTSLHWWMIATALSMLLVAVITFAGLSLLGVPGALALAVIAGALQFVPIVGPVLAAVPMVAAAITVSPSTGFWVVLFYLTVAQLESNFITPWIMQRAVHLPAALTLLSEALLGAVFGFLGLLLAVPILAIVLVAAKTLYVEPMEAAADAPARGEPATRGGGPGRLRASP